ncbi:bacitracin ABC transporter ATP-binding protein [Clostridium carboxidivorans P7]|uniref:ABC transporter related protein n=1 Tax=Clostridium carboxidivorans P7 TaxID=536227 RepID=C6PPP9_9CLOT|nr:ABC transporter ATP-binding protein [Clostridium carboxidivorans]AKN30340.1 bacitracin ABC transporter ATP-binding protein [Clostridium carboxidivorans P7]EET88779.1 ABC transporter related protein [Clostridium carboxidivorans P7]
MNIMEVRDVKKEYGSKNGGSKSNALNGVSFSVQKGEFLGIMGPSGAGKSTLLNVISTIDSPTSGTITLGGKSFLKLNEDELSMFRRKQLGFIFQDYNLLDTLTLKENIILPLSLSKVNVASMEEKLKKISEILNIGNILGKYPYEVSGGQKQRAAAARAIITDPEIVFADEPTGALDSKSSTELLNNLSLLNKDNEATIVMVTHDAFAASYCDRIIFIKDGMLDTEIEKTGSRKDFYNEILRTLSIVGGTESELA